MPLLWVSGLLSFAVTVAAIFVLRPLAFRVGLVDRPGGRKSHIGEVPLVGGAALFAALVVVPAGLHEPWPHWLPAMLFSGLVILCLGTLDDWFDIKPAVRVVAQIICGLIVIAGSGLKLDSLGDLLGAGPVNLGSLATLFTLFCFVGVMNGANLMDGANGLAGGIGLIVCGTFAIAAGIVGAHSTELALVLIAGGLVAFLLFNFRVRKGAPSRAFLGNAGSLLLGLVITIAAIALSQRHVDAMPPICAVWISGVLIIDTLSVMGRRIARRRNPFSPDRTHLHHLLLSSGLEERWAVASLWVVQLLLSAAGMLAWRNGVPDWLMFYGFLGLFALYSVAVELAWRSIHRRAAQAASDVEPLVLPKAA